MKIFLSHAAKDAELARQLAHLLRQQAFTVWLPEDEIAPGENWAAKRGEALSTSDLMVILLSPDAASSEQLQNDVVFAIGSQHFEHRVFTVFVGPTQMAGVDVPWILLKLPHRQVESSRDFPDAVRDIARFSADSGVSRSNA